MYGDLTMIWTDTYISRCKLSRDDEEHPLQAFFNISQESHEDKLGDFHFCVLFNNIKALSHDTHTKNADFHPLCQNAHNSFSFKDDLKASLQ